MRQLVPLVRCDGCNADLPPETRSTALSISRDTGKTLRYSGELCGDCADVLYDKLDNALGSYLALEAKSGKRVKPARPATKNDSEPTPLSSTQSVEDRTCPICPDFVSASRAGLSAHLHYTHKTGFRAAGIAKAPTGRRAQS